MQKITCRFENVHALVVDDYFVNQELAQGMLEMMGCRVDIAEDGEEALQMARHTAYDIIFMDLQMPGKDGYDTTRTLRADSTPNDHTPIIALSANAMTSDRQRCLDAGMNDYLAKPLEGQKLEAVLTTHLGSHLKTDG